MIVVKRFGNFLNHTRIAIFNEIRSNFYARYWEMYLITYLIGEGYTVHCPKPGPDVGIEFDKRRIWFKRHSPTRGADGTVDECHAKKW